MNPKDDTAALQEVEELQRYELMIVFAPDMNQEETEKELDKVRKQIKTLNGEIYHEDIWDIRDLAYEIKNYDKGYYVIFYFTLDPVDIKKLEEGYHLNIKLLRYLIVKSPKNYEIKKLEELMAKSTERRGAPVKQREERPEKKAEKKEEPKKEETSKEESKEEVVEKKEEAPKKEEPKEEAPKEEKKTMDISDLDSKLESILDDPDIDIKL